MALDSDDISRLYAAHAGDVLRFLARRTLQAEVAMDLMAETFAQAFIDRGRFRGSDDAAALAWIFGIGRHQLGKYFRRGAVEQRAMRKLGLELNELAEADYERIDELGGLRSRRLAVATALAELSRAHREALQLRVVEERSYPDLARMLGVTEQTARARVSRALRTLAKATEHLEESADHA